MRPTKQPHNFRENGLVLQDLNIKHDQKKKIETERDGYKTYEICI